MICPLTFLQLHLFPYKCQLFARTEALAFKLAQPNAAKCAKLVLSMADGLWHCHLRINNDVLRELSRFK